MTINSLKKEEIMKFLEKNSDKVFTLNQIKEEVNIHIYKAELLMYQLFSDKKNRIKIEEKGKFTFWGIEE